MFAFLITLFTKVIKMSMLLNKCLCSTIVFKNHFYQIIIVFFENGFKISKTIPFTKNSVFMKKTNKNRKKENQN